jgi:tetratricopeptide (TPR) repeat protein
VEVAVTILIAAFLLLATIPVFAIYAKDDEWIGDWVVPRSYDIPIFDKDGKLLLNLILSPAKVLGVTGDSLNIRHAQFPGPYEGFVKKSAVVNLSEAASFFTDMIIRNESDFYSWLCRAKVWLVEGKHDKAIEDLTQAIRIYHSSFTFTHRGIAWRVKQDYDKAIMDFDVAIQLEPEVAVTYLNRGSAWKAKLEFDKAIADFSEAIRLNPNDGFVFFTRGCIWCEKKEFDKAIKDFDEALRLNPQAAIDYSYHDSLWNSLLEIDMAIENSDAAMPVDKLNAITFTGRGTAWSAKQEYDKAVRDYEEAIRLDPQYSYSFNNLAWLLATCPVAKVRDGKRAVELATKSCGLSTWKKANSLGTLAVAYAEAGEFDKAIENQQKALTDREYEQSYGVEGRARLRLFEQKKPYHVPAVQD